MSDLLGKKVVITRADHQKGEAHNLLRSLGAKVYDLPALEIGPPSDWGPLDEALVELDHFHWIIFSSANGVEAVQSRLKIIGKTFSDLPHTLKIAAVGRKTGAYLQKLGVAPDFVPPTFVADSLIEFFPVSGFGLSILLPRVQSGGRKILAEAFCKAGARVVEVAAYESSCPKCMPEATQKAFLHSEIDAIGFTSSKTAQYTAQLMQNTFGLSWQERLSRVKILSIGPQTSIGCKKYLGRVDVEANPHDLDGLIQTFLFALT